MGYTFKNIKVWQKAHELVLKIYQITKKFPEDEKYGLVSQLRRSASSVPANIVEGYKRKTKKDFGHFLNMAESSLEETKYHLLLAYDLKYVPEKTYELVSDLSEEVGRMLHGFHKKVKET